MEPRPHERGKRNSLRCLHFDYGASMEPRPHERGKDQTALLKISTRALQWSHVLTNVERIVSPPGLLQDQWLQWSHVLTNVESQAQNGYRKSQKGSFNGATSSRTWKAREKADFIGDGSSFNGATSSRTWKALTPHTTRQAGKASMEPRPHERGKKPNDARTKRNHLRFNGATSSRTWKGLTCRVQVKLITIASMEPRPHERGKQRWWRTIGAARCCFNGATSSRTWKDSDRLARKSTALTLQWSHVLTNVERSLLQGESQRRQRASMEPRPHERGKKQN